MKKEVIDFTILILIICALIIPRANIETAKAVISEDYSEITYNGNKYVPVEQKYLPLEIKNTISQTPSYDMINATVENCNYFIDKFSTNSIAIKESDGETFIYLNTDFDENESDYYCSKTYKDKIEY